jgi:hypothetical protein
MVENDLASRSLQTQQIRQSEQSQGKKPNSSTYLFFSLAGNIAAIKVTYFGSLVMDAGFIYSLTFTWRDLIHKQLRPGVALDILSADEDRHWLHPDGTAGRADRYQGLPLLDPRSTAKLAAVDAGLCLQCRFHPCRQPAFSHHRLCGHSWSRWPAADDLDQSHSQESNDDCAPRGKQRGVQHKIKNVQHAQKKYSILK